MPFPALPFSHLPLRQSREFGNLVLNSPTAAFWTQPCNVFFWRSLSALVIGHILTKVNGNGALRVDVLSVAPARLPGDKKVDMRLHEKGDSKLPWRKAGQPRHLVNVEDSDQ